MFAVAGGPSFTGSPLTWSLLFVRQPEPDLEFTEEELEQTTNVRSSSSMKPPKKSGGRPLLWILLLALVGGGAYLAMEPEMLTDLLGPILGESPTPQPQPSIARKPAPTMPAPTTAQPGPAAPSAETPAVPAPQAAAPGSIPAPAPAPGMPTASAPMQPAAPAPVAPVVSSPNPLFAEGQKVTIMLGPATPGDVVTLMQDSTGTKPGPAIRPGSTLTILDGDLQNGLWVYSVRSDDGVKGWIAENRLRMKP